MVTPAGMNTDDQASRLVLQNEFLARAKSLANLREVYRSSLVTQLVRESLAVGLRLEAKIFEAAYGDPAGREYWKGQLSEPILVYKLADVLSVHSAENADQQESARIATVLAFRDAAEAGEDWFIGDTRALLVLKNRERNFTSLGEIKVHPRAAVAWLLAKPKRMHLVPESLQRFLQIDETSGKARPLTEKAAKRFVTDYINSEQGQGRRPTVEGAEAAAKRANLHGGRHYLRAAFNHLMGGRRGRPAKETAKK
jgi:hypothetical protein